MKRTLIVAGLILAGIIASFVAGYVTRGKRPPEVVEILKTDTLTIRDTTVIDRPVYIRERVVDTVMYAVHIVDTLHQLDSIYVPLVRTQREYADSTYHAWVSGIDPALDSLNVYNRTQVVTTVVQKPTKHWHIGVNAGYGITTKGLAPYWGVGLSYSFFSF